LGNDTLARGSAPTALQGFGIGLRPPHYADVLEHYEQLDFVEVISENFMIKGGKPLWMLDRVRERLPVALHGVSMSIGSAGGVDRSYLEQLKQLVDRIKPALVSDHLCWTGIGGMTTHDLLPLPYTQEALEIVCRNVILAQDILEREILLENPSTYIQFEGDDFGEADFLAELCTQTGCGLLLDVNNVYVSAVNHRFDVGDYLGRLPVDRVKQIHLAGHSQGKSLLIDTHDTPVCDAVWSLYAEAVQCFGPVASMIERDDNIPALDELITELDHARGIVDQAKLQLA
jgi:uncharacterized protein